MEVALKSTKFHWSGRAQATEINVTHIDSCGQGLSSVPACRNKDRLSNSLYPLPTILTVGKIFIEIV
ncbi:hypothetical protein QQF64_010666 [Cirrhinus molitorella]|uniref:Uncharacterized protein n=1 Tax=Cirrhinus molitorella TaxID=172907 RepID=A0ABR3LX12_9TELE